MIIFLADGRLGNQLFQYAFLKTLQKENEKIIVSGFEDIKEVFEDSDFTNINKRNRWLKFLLFRLLKPVFNFLSDMRVISSVEVIREKVLEKFSRESCAVSTKKGFLSDITFVKLGFFQSESFFDKKKLGDIKIKKEYLSKAAKILSNIPQNNHKIFVHIRRGDYKNYKVYGKSTLLPITYYKEQIEWFICNKENCFFIFVSDDNSYIEKEFEYIENKILSSSKHFGTDLAIMTKCKSAILSPSSFGWWGSYLMKGKDTVFAPKYWLGFGSSIDFQSQSVSSYITEIKVK